MKMKEPAPSPPSTSSSSSSKSSSSSSFEYEFGGPIGALLTMLSLPLLTLLLTHWAGHGQIVWDEVFHLLFFHDGGQSCSSANLTGSADSSGYLNSILSMANLRSSSSLSSCSSSSSTSRIATTIDRLLHFLCPACGDDPLLHLFQCAIVIPCWFLFQVLLERLLPCELVEGAPLPTMTTQHRPHPTANGSSSSNGYEIMLNGSKSYEIVEETNGRGASSNDMPTTTTTTTKRLTYRINGHLAFWVTLLLLNVGWPTWRNIVITTTTATSLMTAYSSASASAVVLTFGKAPLTWLYDHYTLLAFVTIVYALGLSTYLYIKSYNYEVNTTTGKKVPVLLAAGGNSGNIIYDYFMGRELNPRAIKGTFDWKEFCELRPGLIGWFILNMAMLTKQYETLGYVTGSMILINIFQGMYVWDALYQERAILTTMDITTDGFGYMLIFGDLVWVPYTYSLQSRYLVDHDPYLPWYALLGIIMVNIIGYLIFRGANGQKDAFRRNPESMDVSHLTYLHTKRGTKLLTSGWWGLARKINYTGDWIMGLSWCMLCGFDSIVPYYYAIYFAILLVHRSVRDDHMCREKYGDDWDRYKEFVPYRFIPGII